MRLSHSVRTIDNEILLPAGALITENTLSELITSSEKASHRSLPLMEYGSVKKDLLDFLRTPPYSTIFPEKRHLDELLEEFKAIKLKEPVLDSLHYFKSNDFYSYRHFLTVFALTTLLSRDLILGHAERLGLASSGPTHDIGKICVPVYILKKSTPLTRTEKNFLDSHALSGYVLLSYYSRSRDTLASRVARDHHERSNGSGYPRGVPLRDILVEIIAACDVYDALISPRPYRKKPFDNRSALEEMTTMAQRGEFSWDVIRALVACNRRSRPHYTATVIADKKRGTPPPGNLHGIIAEDLKE